MPAIEVAIVQFDPQIGQMERNMAHVDAMIASLSAADNLSILMLPELAFSGYVLRSKEEAARVAEPAGDGPVFRWCQRHARRLRCLVTCGYVERGGRGTAADGDALYNAVLVVDRDGSLACSPRKTFLYETDKPWATAGSGFQSWRCPWLGTDIGPDGGSGDGGSGDGGPDGTGGGRVLAFGVCMDINPDDFRAPFEAFELARFCVARRCDLLLLTCAWCDFEPPDAPERPTLEYWAARLAPVTRALRDRGDGGDGGDVFLLAANRIGEERGTFFVGASCVLGLRRPEVLAYAPRRQETVVRVSLPA